MSVASKVSTGTTGADDGLLRSIEAAVAHYRWGSRCSPPWQERKRLDSSEGFLYNWTDYLGASPRKCMHTSNGVSASSRARASGFALKRPRLWRTQQDVLHICTVEMKRNCGNFVCDLEWSGQETGAKLGFQGPWQL